jgi:hypothetical protein
MSRTTMQIWGAPLALAVLTVVGLVSALLGDGIWDAVSAVTLGIPVAVGAWYSLRRQPARR